MDFCAGLLICGGPTADSVDTMVTLNTKNVLMTIYTPEDTAYTDLDLIIKQCTAKMIEYNGGETETKIF